MIQSCNGCAIITYTCARYHACGECQVPRRSALHAPGARRPAALRGWPRVLQATLHALRIPYRFSNRTSWMSYNSPTIFLLNPMDSLRSLLIPYNRPEPYGVATLPIVSLPFPYSFPTVSLQFPYSLPTVSSGPPYSFPARKHNGQHADHHCHQPFHFSVAPVAAAARPLRAAHPLCQPSPRLATEAPAGQPRSATKQSRLRRAKLTKPQGAPTKPAGPSGR